MEKEPGLFIGVVAVLGNEKPHSVRSNEGGFAR
jgi:hypothetical protein